MSRPIKFRAWVKSEAKMFPVINLRFSGDSVREVFILGNIYPAYATNAGRKPAYGAKTNRVQPNNFELMQYTGLKDKNGTEIYEGDIIVWRGYSSLGKPCPKCGHTESGDEIMEVRWGATGWAHTSDSSDDGWYHFDRSDLNDLARRIEVIGNIYEHPELLK